MPFAATWVDLERMTVSEISQMEKDKYHEITYIWNKKGDTNEHICKTEMDSQMQKTSLWLPKGNGRDKV